MVRRYDVPGIDGLNFVLEAALGGGGIASLRPDPQGNNNLIKKYTIILLFNILFTITQVKPMDKFWGTLH